MPSAGATGTGVISGGEALGPMPLDAEAQAAVAAGETVVRETTIGSAPVRVMAVAVPTINGSATVMVIGDRTAEVDTLRTLLVVLLVGGLAVLAASVAVGYVYAGRALVPIRESLQRQREFAADASHELRTPLTITRAAIAELRRGRDDPATVDRALDDLDAGATRMELLVDDLLLLARTDADAIDIVDGRHRPRARRGRGHGGARGRGRSRGRAPGAGRRSRRRSAGTRPASASWPGSWWTTPSGTHRRVAG